MSDQKSTGNTDSKATVAKAPKVAKTPKVKTPKAVKESDGKEHRGRKTNSTSARQIRLARFAAKEAAGIEVKRGRPRKEGVEKVAKVKTPKVTKPTSVKKETVKKVSETETPVAVKAKAKV